MAAFIDVAEVYLPTFGALLRQARLVRALNTLIAGFSLGFGLILAIGAQNAFVLKQGIRNHHVFWVCLCLRCPTRY